MPAYGQRFLNTNSDEAGRELIVCSHFSCPHQLLALARTIILDVRGTVPQDNRRPRRENAGSVIRDCARRWHCSYPISVLEGVTRRKNESSKVGKSAVLRIDIQRFSNCGSVLIALDPAIGIIIRAEIHVNSTLVLHAPCISGTRIFDTGGPHRARLRKCKIRPKNIPAEIHISSIFCIDIERFPGSGAVLIALDPTI
jgi:hypothetical protein